MTTLKPVRDELVAFARQALLDGRPPAPGLSQPAVLPSAFEEPAWRDSPLFRPYRTGLSVWLADAIDWFGSTNSDPAAQRRREEIGQEWALLRLTALLADSEWMRVINVGIQSHLLRTVPLRLQAAPSNPRRPRDLDATRFSLSGSHSIYYAYCALLVYILSNETFVRQLALLGAASMYAREIEDHILERFRRHLRVALNQAVAFIHKHQPFLIPADLIAADGFVAALLQIPQVRWKELAPLARASPISRILRLPALLRLAGGEQALTEGLRSPEGMEMRTGLFCLARTPQLAGLSHRLSQHLADACQPAVPQAIFDELAGAIRSIVDDFSFRYSDVRPEGTAYEEADYWAGLLLFRAYCLADRDSTLAQVRGRSYSGSDYLSALGQAGMLEQLFRERPAARWPGRLALFENDHETVFRRLYHAYR